MREQVCLPETPTTIAVLSPPPTDFVCWAFARLQGWRICAHGWLRHRPPAPGTAKGFIFISIEDETGIANVIVTPDPMIGSAWW